VFAVATVLVLGLAYGPLLVRFFANQWSKPHYQYFPFVIGAFVLLLWHRSSQAEPREAERGPTYRRAASIFLVGAAGLLALAYLVNSPWLAYLSLIGVVTSCFLRVAAGWHVPYLWGVWLLLWLILPMPLARDQQLIGFLQRLSSKLSSFVLDWASVPHLMEGNRLLFADKEFFVDEACSGIVSVLSIIACAVIYGVWRNRPPMHVVTLAIAGVGWATMMNVMRISVIAIAYHGYGVDWSKGTPHELLGLAIFLCTFLALVSTDYALAVLLAPIKALDGQLYTDSVWFGRRLVDMWDWIQNLGRPVALAGTAPAGTTNEDLIIGKLGLGAAAQASGFPPSKPWSENRPADGETFDENPGSRRLAIGSRLVFGVVPLVAFGVLAGTQLAIPLLFQKQAARPSESLQRALALNASALPKKCATMNQASFAPQERERDNLFGNFSRTYEYRDERGTKYLVSCDFPLEPDGHELTNCYRGIGWTLTRRELREGATAAEGSGAWGYAEADFYKPEEGYAFLVFCSFDEYGGRVTPPSYTLWDDIQRTFERQLYSTRSDRTFQVQVWTTGSLAIDDKQRETARELLIDARDRFRSVVIDGADAEAEVAPDTKPRAAGKEAAEKQFSS
jgi:exosortase